MSELISIIVPVYKVEAYLSECLDSIKQQSYSNCINRPINWSSVNAILEQKRNECKNLLLTELSK